MSKSPTALWLARRTVYHHEIDQQALTLGRLEHAAILSRKAMFLFLENYIDPEDRKGQMFSPLLWEGGHHGVPASVFQITGQDPLRDEGLVYERILREDHGIKTKVHVYPGLPHGFHSVAPTLDVSKKFVQDSVAGVKWLLEQK